MIQTRSRSRYVQSCYLVCFWDVLTPKGTCTGVKGPFRLEPLHTVERRGSGDLPGLWPRPSSTQSPESPASLFCAWFSLPHWSLPLGLFTSLIWQSRLVLSKLVCCPLCSLWLGQWKGPRNRCSPSLPCSFQMWEEWAGGGLQAAAL